MSRWWRMALLAALTGCGTLRSDSVGPPADAPADVPRLLRTDLRVPDPPRHQRTTVWMRRLCADHARVGDRGLGALRTAPPVPRLMAILAEEGVPPEMVAVPAVESGFRAGVRGRHGERGIWQIRPATARAMGLRVSARRDDRLHLERSTRAAARYLARLHRRYGAWPLALAAYNAGEGRVDRALARHPKAAFWDLADRRALSAHSRNYVPRVLAMMELMTRPEACRPATAVNAPDEARAARRIAAQPCGLSVICAQ